MPFRKRYYSLADAIARTRERVGGSDTGVEKDGEIALVKRGPFEPSKMCGMGFHECEESPLHLRAELYASCHQAYHYEAHYPLEAT
jgi:hypothetical protein